jgi:Spy/CpxP family protein refolding chaperone
MRLIMYIFLGAVLALWTTTPITSAQEFSKAMPGVVLAGMGGSGMGGSGMGGSGMMGGGQGMSDLWNALSRMWGSENPNSFDHRSNSTERLRSEIREKRQELRSMVQSSNPDRSAIDQKIRELDRLESELYDR